MEKFITIIIMFAAVLISANAEENRISYDFGIGFGQYSIPPAATYGGIDRESYNSASNAIIEETEAALDELYGRSSSSMAFLIAAEIGFVPHFASAIRGVLMPGNVAELRTSGEIGEESYSIRRGNPFQSLDFSLKYYMNEDRFGPFVGIGVSSFRSGYEVEINRGESSSGSSEHNGTVALLSGGTRFRLFRPNRSSRGLTAKIYANYYPMEELGSIAVTLGFGQ